MAEEEDLQKLLDACCSQHYCTCKEKPGAPCGKDENGVEITVEVVSEPNDGAEITSKNDSGNSGIVETNLASNKCETTEQVCCICGKPIRGSSAPVEDTIVIETTIDSSPPEEESEPLGCGLEDCDTEFCTSQSLPCENMEEPAVNDDTPADASDAVEEKQPSETETDEAPEPPPEEGSEEKTESANGENETGPSDQVEPGAKKPCVCKGGAPKDPPPEE